MAMTNWADKQTKPVETKKKKKNHRGGNCPPPPPRGTATAINHNSL